ncbi:hypothetical protein BMG03_13730 [Thioclava nitratireducens]|uniref:DUF4935 domain-containing protein n=1 Tax=Thioclava nitratireducens TaxID=1915078 RepID=A0ABM6IJ91_9RHOB|nr:PIN domain-containing protein [Thioclava nitratireducens]AQS48735.1 hypothetical protein BMG03_13730 [Thioclava nitratireducens]
MPLVDDDQIKVLLADGSISAISVDTSIFDEKQLQLDSATMQALATFKGKPFQFVLSSTVESEVLAHLLKATEEALQAARRGVGKALAAFGTVAPSRDDLLVQITGGKTPEEVAKERWGRFVDDTGCEVLADTDLVATSTLFDAYFGGKPPFGTGRKKDEFPDALALNALENMAKDHGTCILVVSKDGDWRSYCEKSEKLYLVSEIERALSLVTDAPLGLRTAILAWLSEDGGGREEVHQGIAHNVEQIDFTANAHPTHGEVELFAWAGQIQSIDWPEEGDIDIIEVDETSEGGALRVVLSLPLDLVVRVPVEMSFSFWDGVDKESIGMGGRSVEVDEELYERSTVVIEVHKLGSEDEEIVLIESELEDRYHEIELGEVDMFDPEDYWDGEEPE